MHIPHIPHEGKSIEEKFILRSKNGSTAILSSFFVGGETFV